MVYEYDGTLLNLLSTVDGPESEDRFGSALAMTPDGNRLLVGAPGTAGTSPGAVYCYEWNGIEWNFVFSLPGSGASDNLGTSVAILASDGNTIAMGAPNHEGDLGAIRVYSTSGFFWSQVGEDIIGEPGDFLGRSVAAGPKGRVVAGTANGSFRVYEYNPQTRVWDTIGSNEPALGSNVASIAANANGDVGIGLENESVVVYGL